MALSSAVFIFSALAIGIATHPSHALATNNHTSTQFPVGVNREQENWVILVAAWKGWGMGYREQADVSRAFHLFRKHGVPSSNVITLMFDDVASDPRNPYPGTIRNAPGGPDVHRGVVVDYSHTQVTATTFLRVLNGTAHGKRLVGHANNVFVFFDGPGMSGAMGFADGSLLSTAELWDAAREGKTARRFNHLLFYHVGESDIYTKIPVDLAGSVVYAVTASRPHESSYGFYCNVKIFDTCLATQFAVGWITDLELHGFNRTLESNFHATYQFCFNQSSAVSSHATRYGAVKKMSSMTFAELLGTRTTRT